MTTSTLSTLVTAITYGASLVVSLAFFIAWAIVLAVVVRKHRPDVIWPFAASVVISFLATLFSIGVTIASRTLVAGHVDEYLVFYGATSAASTLMHAASSTFLIVGVAKLARPPIA